MMKTWTALIFLCLTACASQGVREPAEEGRSGEAGNAGASGQDGQAGASIVAAGCRDFVSQSVRSLNQAWTREKWLGLAAFVCAEESLSPSEVRPLQKIMDLKTSMLLASGYFPEVSSVPATADTLEGLAEKIGFFGKLVQRLQDGPEKNFGCFGGKGRDRLGGERDYRVCFHSSFRHLEADGQVVTRFSAEVFDLHPSYGNPSSPFARESVSLRILPPLCENGAPRLLAEEEGSTQGQSFVRKVLATCEAFETTYSALYPSVRLTYSRK